MTGRFQLAALVAVMFSTVSLGTGAIRANLGMLGCDNLRASSSVGACKSGLETCAGITGPNLCNTNLGGDRTLYTVKEDFPTSCISTTNLTNCNQPNENCYGQVRCVWQDNECKPIGEPALWIQEKKPTTEPCASGEPGDPT